MATLLVLACFAGAGLLGWHSQDTPWNVPAVELGGLSWFKALQAGLAGELRAATADLWMPVLGFVLLAAGGLLGWAVSAGPFARRLSAAMAWTLVGLAGVCVAENLLLRAAVNASPDGAHLGAYVLWLQGAAFLRYALLPIATLVAVLGAVTTLARLTVSVWDAAIELGLRGIIVRAGKTLAKVRHVGTAFPQLLARVLKTLKALGRRILGLREAPARRETAQVRMPGDDAHWRCTAALPPGKPGEPAPRVPGGLGICLSGGGIRSATFALGALQALQGHSPLATADGGSELTRARYLTAVSGGAYTAGALLLAAHPLPTADQNPAQKPYWVRWWAALQRRCARLWDPARIEEAPAPAAITADGQDGHTRGETPPGQQTASLDYEHVFRPGSPEFDHLRRHSSYIADGFREWAIAILVVIRGGLLSTLFLGLVALVAGRWAGFLYHEIRRSADLMSPWHPVWGAVLATLSVVAVALALWLLSTRPSLPKKARRGLAEAAKMTSILVAALVILGAIIPIVTWASMRIINLTGGAGQGGQAGGTPAGGAAKGIALGMIGVFITVLGLLSRNRTEILKAAQQQAETWRRLLGDVVGRVMQWLAVYTGLAIVATVYLIVFGYSTYIAAKTNPDSRPAIGWGVPHWTSPLTNIQLTLGLTALLVIVYLLVDETLMGLHPFYRRRLTSAFAVRRVRCAGTESHPSGYMARPYAWEEETRLETYGAPQKQDGSLLRPQVIFCAAAHCSDPDETPPGRHVLPFTFSYDAVGGPEVGWCRTSVLRDRMSNRLQADLTVQTAMAVSGAAFASETGAYRNPATVILALTNARLGAWIAHPGQMTDSGRDWWQARPPRVRRLSYLVREIFGWYPKELPLVFVTDGGHYENLGLLELLRHRCTEIYCFDASSDTETFAASLAQSITLAYDELGVTVTPDHPEKSDPRTGGKDVEANDFQGRLAETPIITATVTYPPSESDGQAVHGVLVIGRATLDAHTPWEIQRHAAAHPRFPNDAIGDQWFDDSKFNAYTGLGRHVGKRAIKAMETMTSIVTSPDGLEGRRGHAHQIAGPSRGTRPKARSSVPRHPSERAVS